MESNHWNDKLVAGSAWLHSKDHMSKGHDSEPNLKSLKVWLLRKKNVIFLFSKFKNSLLQIWHQ